MKRISDTLAFFLKLATVQTITNRKFDLRLSIGGISFTDFQVLYHLSQAPEEKLRRIDLAEKLALTASGVTRLLGPMEKIGLVTRLASERDARVSFVKLAPGGKRLLTERMEDAEALAEDLLPALKTRNGDARDLFAMLRLGPF